MAEWLTDAETIREAVRARYAAAAEQARAGRSACCGAASSCGADAAVARGGFGASLYDEGADGDVPEAARAGLARMR